MASKQLGRLRQWAGEVISSSTKTSVSEEFLELEKDIDRRKEGIHRLLVASEAYQHALSKKKSSDVLPEEDKFLPVDTLGIVMITHGEEFGHDSVFGNALVKLGRAHCKIATLQEAFALTFKDTFIASMEKFKEDIKEYESLRKKLEARRSTQDSATAKFEKLRDSKKEKDKREAEDEMERAKQRYEETEEEVEAHMHAIQENEHSQHHDLTVLLDLETGFVQNYLDVLKDVKAEWQDRPDTKRTYTRRDSQGGSAFKLPPRLNGTTNGRARANSTNTSPDSSDEADAGRTTPVRRKHSRTNSNGSKPPSRSASRLSRKRTNSNARSLKGDDKDGEKEEKDKNKEKEKEKERTRRMSMADWASSAVEGLTGTKSKKNKADKETFSTLENEGSPTTAESSSKPSSTFLALTRRSSKSKSKESLGADSPSIPSRILKPPSMQDRKLVRALYDFSGSSDELTFKTGNEIVVVNEVLDDWWMGELDGKTGLFPASYIEVIGTTTGATSTAATPQLPARKLSGFKNAMAAKNPNVVDSDNYLTSDADDDFNELSAAKPLTVRSPIFYGRMGVHNNMDDAASFTDTASVLDDAVSPPSTKQTFAADNDWFSENKTHGQAPSQSLGATLFGGGGSGGAAAANKRKTALGTIKLTDPAQQPLISRSSAAAAAAEDSDNAAHSTPFASNTSLTSFNAVAITGTGYPNASYNSPISVSTGNGNGNGISGSTRSSPTTKKAPPPPPPRRPTATPLPTPPIPLRRTPGGSGSVSTLGNSFYAPSVSASVSTSSSLSSGTGTTPPEGQGYDRSPFESAIELGDQTKCQTFRQNPFKPKGMCSNCLEFHD